MNKVMSRIRTGYSFNFFIGYLACMAYSSFDRYGLWSWEFLIMLSLTAFGFYKVSDYEEKTEKVIRDRALLWSREESEDD